ncbi:helix-turn-helix transcriptional regulator [Halocalculus aciditolerans]|uniref:DUF7343 domain-containing protein n=1 Tax=Halocalculus aciditolerans TaxID=1383812 RepID=A0A830FM98_9EURY|nr:MarR family transcriptional regulator [Halocalculus aciditolerans]GGL66662.1 hypothetical protein GCM10009039_25760 [Halocalculus aciditolerans]
MDSPALRNVHLLAAVVFVASVLVLAVQLITPLPIVVSLGESGTQTARVGQYFAYDDVAVVVVASVLSGASATYLVLHDRAHRLVDQLGNADPESHPRPEPNGGTETGDGGERDGEDGSSRREQWEKTAESLKNNEATVYTLLIEAGGERPQRELVEETDLSKATVSRTLDKLENRGLVERKRSGMGNTIRLQ